ncbi:UNVERIFIED_CONTAM: hypothetical protein Slati_3078500 [Sesamum latifolium]|uniref:Reverse transcriptase domain-containing protein n=1 Tax=Sesamum latifolium TaxID=2727402 RepID=A0AAW2UWU5_9LAMI
MFAVTRKLKALKLVFRALRQKKGDLSNNVKLAASFLDAAQNLLAQDRQNPIFLHLEFCCKMVLQLATKLEQHMLHQRAKLAWMKGRDQYSRIFFRKVAKQRSSKRVFQITDSTGQTKHVISEDEALLLVQLVTPGEIKQALFDIDEIKALGPDGYSSGFFKAAWPVVGEEVNTPTVLAEFRPISCCNVLYKVITKILVQRMRGILDKLISPSHNAFVPGCSIGENILLAQELFNGYNQQHLPPRCALKVDLRKAYDTVEWDFLSAVLALFGFPEQFILWIEECVTTPSFSVCLNGPLMVSLEERGGYDRGTLCPHIFLCLLWRSSLLFYSNSLTKIADSLIIGSVVSYTCSNLGLLMIYCYSVGQIRIRSLFSSVPLRRSLTSRDFRLIFRRAISYYPGRRSSKGYTSIYLGLSGRSSSPALFGPTSPGFMTVYSGLQTNSPENNSHIRGWDGIMLSFAGRVQLIKSVLTALQVCRPVTEGDLGIRDLLALNRGLMSRHLWRVIIADRSSIWVDWIFHYRLRGNSIWMVSDRSGSWNGAEIGSFMVTSATALLSTVIMEGSWNWPPITNMESIEITHSLPIIHGGMDPILWTGPGDSFSSTAAYDMLHPPGPKVDWSSLLVGTFKIPRHRFIL